VGSENHTPGRLIRVPGRYWEAFGELAGERRRSAVVLEFIRWYVGEPGARLPKPPKASPQQATTATTGPSASPRNTPAPPAGTQGR
jgi:hypothetical protein